MNSCEAVAMVQGKVSHFDGDSVAMVICIGIFHISQPHLSLEQHNN